eukprot:1157198-Pelagomonas_calceolata.AAC.1
MSRRHIGSKSLPHQRIRGKLMWVSRVSGSMQPQGTGMLHGKKIQTQAYLAHRAMPATGLLPPACSLEP